MTTAESAPPSFVWVNATSSRPPADPDVRTNIRRQAMRDVAVDRRRSGRHANPNRRQLPVFVDDPQAGPVATPTIVPTPSFQTQGLEGTGERIVERHEFEETLYDLHNAYASPRGQSIAGPRQPEGTLVDLQNVNATFRARLPEPIPEDPLDTIVDRFQELSLLTSVEVAHVTGTLQLDDPAKLALLVGNRNESYSSFFPSRYGHSVPITAAADCLLARLRCLATYYTTGVRVPEADKAFLNIRALRSVQEAINDPAQRQSADVLCATEMLAFYEVSNEVPRCRDKVINLALKQLLNPYGDSAWTRHAAGAASLIRARGPGNHQTDLQRSLLLSLAGGIVSNHQLRQHGQPYVLSHLTDSRRHTCQRSLLPRRRSMGGSASFHDHRESSHPRKE